MVIRAYLKNLSRSELFAVMTCGMSTVAGSIMVLYANLLAPVVDGALGHAARRWMWCDTDRDGVGVEQLVGRALRAVAVEQWQCKQLVGKMVVDRRRRGARPYGGAVTGDGCRYAGSDH